MRIKVLSRSEVESGAAEGADGVISIRGTASGSEPELATALVQATRGESARLVAPVSLDTKLRSLQMLLDRPAIASELVRMRWPR